MSRYEELLNEISDSICKSEEHNAYRSDFYEMSLGSIKAIAKHSEEIIKAVESNNEQVKKNLTESWLQGKIAITEDYMRTIHDFLMFVNDRDDTDSIEAKDSRPGLWENIRKKKEREGKNYKPAKTKKEGRPDKENWEKLTKKQDK